TRSACCAPAPSGHAAAPLRNAMNSRRLMCSPLTRVPAYHTARGEAVLCTTANLHARCRLWVNLGPSTRSAECPSYPRQRTSRGPPGRSQKCQFRTLAVQQGGLHERGMMRAISSLSTASRALVGRRLEHDAEKACPALDGGCVAVFEKHHAPTIG